MRGFITRMPNGKVQIKKGKSKKVFSKLVGSRREVMNGTAYETSGRRTKADFVMNKNGRYVSKKKHQTAKKEKRLEKAGYFTKKGKFGAVFKGDKKTKNKRGKRKGNK